jgi:Tol biopolymer transport system component
LSRPGRSLDTNLPSSEIALLDLKTSTLGALSLKATRYLGFFNAVWSPDGSRLAFLSVDTSAAKTGTCGALLHTTANSSSRAYLNKTLGGATEVWADGWFNVKVEGASGSNVPYWRLFDSGGNRLVDVYRTNVAGALQQVSVTLGERRSARR